MKPTILIQEFEKLAEELGIKIIQDRGDFKGGFCLLEQEGIIVINKLQPLEQRIHSLAKAFAQLDTSQIFVKPILRDYMESEGVLPQLNQ